MIEQIMGLGEVWSMFPESTATLDGVQALKVSLNVCRTAAHMTNGHRT